jgi:hypothetical protein
MLFELQTTCRTSGIRAERSWTVTKFQSKWKPDNRLTSDGPRSYWSVDSVRTTGPSEVSRQTETGSPKRRVKIRFSKAILSRSSCSIRCRVSRSLVNRVSIRSTSLAVSSSEGIERLFRPIRKQRVAIVLPFAGRFMLTKHYQTVALLRESWTIRSPRGSRAIFSSDMRISCILCREIDSRTCPHVLVET